MRRRRLLPRLARVALFVLTSGVAVGASSAWGEGASKVAATAWTKISDDDGVTVYREANPEAGSGTIGFRGETLLEATPADVFTVLSDNATAHEWIPLVHGKRSLEQVSETERIEFTHVKMPWPLTDRQFVNRGKIEHLDGGVLRVFVESVDRPEFVEAGKVLGVLKYSEFLLEPRADGRQTFMTITVNSDPKGLIPTWMVNRAQRGWPRDFFKGLTAQLAKRGMLSSGTAVSH